MNCNSSTSDGLSAASAISQPSQDNLPSSSSVPSTVIQLVVPYLTAKEMGCFIFLTSQSMASMLDKDFIYKEICNKLFGKQEMIQKVARKEGYQWIFKERCQKKISLQPTVLEPLPIPKLRPDDMALCIDIRNDKNELVSTKTIDNSMNNNNRLSDLFTKGTLTVDLDVPVLAGKLLGESSCHCWNLTKSSYQGWSAHLHLFVPGRENPTSFQGHTLLDTAFSVWKGYSSIGELAFLQKERTSGLQLTDRGRCIQNRINNNSKTGNWKNYLGLQFKVIFICEKTVRVRSVDAAAGTKSDIQMFSFTQARVEAIRLHETTSGNIQHNLFRKDSGWQVHGVELLHLIEELVVE